MNNMVIRGDIYYADLSGLLGYEQGGYRPVLVVQNDVGNKYAPTTLIAPLTSKIKRNMPTHVFIEAGDGGLRSDSLALLEQVRVVDKNRLKDYVGNLDSDKMTEIDMALLVSFGIASKVVA